MVMSSILVDTNTLGEVHSAIDELEITDNSQNNLDEIVKRLKNLLGPYKVSNAIFLTTILQKYHNLPASFCPYVNITIGFDQFLFFYSSSSILQTKSCAGHNSAPFWSWDFIF